MTQMMESGPGTNPAAMRLGHRLLQTEASRLADRGSDTDPCEEVFNRLFEQLKPIIGVGGFETVLGRATVIAARSHSELARLEIPTHGPPSFEALFQACPEGGDVDAQVALVGEFLAFLGRLIGWGLTLVILRDLWDDAVAEYMTQDDQGSSSQRPNRGEG